MRRSGRVIVSLALVGVAGLLLLIAARRFGRPALIGPGLLLFSVGVFAAGANAILARYVHERSTESGASVTFLGSAAVMIGISLVVTGCVFAAAGVAFTLDAQDRLLAYLLQRPGLPLLAAGTAFGSSGSAAVIGAREWRGSARHFLMRLPERIGGAMLLLLGLALATAGIFETLAPAGFDGALDALLEPLRSAAR